MNSSKLTPVLLNFSTIRNTIWRSVFASADNINEIGPVKSYDEIPGLTKLPIIGRLHHFLPGGQMARASVVDIGLDLYEKYGPIVKFDGILGRRDVIIIFDADTAEHVLRTEDKGIPFRVGFESLDYYRKKTKGSNVPNGLVNDQGAMWKKFRMMVNPIMVQPKTIKLYSDRLNEIADEMIVRLKSLRGPNYMIQSKFDEEINLWSLESVCLIALGRRLNCFRSDLPENSPEKRLIQLSHDIFRIMNEVDFKPNLWRYYPTKTFKKALALYAEQEQLASYFVDKTIEELKVKGEIKTESQKSVLEKLLDLDKNIALTMAVDMLLAGVDTTSNGLIATLYMLAINPDKQDKLREEIMSGVERRPYMRACIKEAMRLMPVVVGNARVTSKDYNILGYRVPKGTQLTFMHQIMSRFEKHYIRANEFIPERWLTTKDDPMHHMHAHPFAFNPFGFGIRSCIGRRIVEVEMDKFLPKIIRNFKLEWFGPAMKVNSSTINYPIGPFNFVFKDV